MIVKVDRGTIKKNIIDNLYKPNFYVALTNIKKLENENEQLNETFMFYYFLYDLMEWICNHKKDKDIKDVIYNKEKYFNKIQEYNGLDKSNTYVELYEFLEKNFRNREEFSWFNIKEKCIILLDKSLQINPNNFEAQFYKLFTLKNYKECFSFLKSNTLPSSIVKRFLNDSSIYYNKTFLDDAQILKKKYSLNNLYSNFIYKKQKEDYLWLYKYFNLNKEEINDNKYISYGEVCFRLEKYDEAIIFLCKKDTKDNTDYFILGECYEKINKKEKAIECYSNYYLSFQPGYWKDRIEKLFKFKAYDKIKQILKNDKSYANKEYKIFYEAKLLNKEKEYTNCINHLSGILDLLKDHHNDLKKDIYLLYISSYYKQIMLYLNDVYDRTIKEKNFNNLWLNYEYLSIYQEFTKYIKKLNIEYNNQYLKKVNKYDNRIQNKYIKFHHKIYHEAKKSNIELTEEKELYYLSFFTEDWSVYQRIEIYKKRLKIESENPNYYLEVGKLYYQKIYPTSYDISQSIKYLENAIFYAEKYFINLNGEAELLLIEIGKNTTVENKKLFDKSMENFIFHNSYQKDIFTIPLKKVVFKYLSFSINTLTSLANNYLYFASSDKLNDPFDVASESLTGKFDNVKINKMDFKTCSLSENNNSKLMWSHYTNEYKGICVGYEFLYLPSYVGKDKVDYKNTTLEEKELFQDIVDHWIVKSNDWVYEEEVRLLHYGEQSKIKYTFDVNEAIKENIIGLNIKSITVGLEMKEEEKEVIKQIINEIEKKQNLKIEIFNTKKVEQKLILEKIVL